MKFTTFFFSIMMLFFFSSCKDDCKDINCNFGFCEDGSCFCDDGYEGDICDIEKRSKFIGQWKGPYICDNEEEEVEIFELYTDSTDTNRVIMVDINGGGGWFGTVSGNQVLFDNIFIWGVHIYTEAVLDKNILTISISYDDSETISTCILTGSRI